MLSLSTYAAPGLVQPAGLPEVAPTSEWWVVVALAIVLVFFASLGVWCWLVCNGHVQECYADWWNRVAVAKCYR
jgi:hypothetical protein